MVRRVVPSSRKVQPLGVTCDWRIFLRISQILATCNLRLTELVPDEVEVPFSPEAVDEESDDFVEGDAAVDDVVGGMECRHSRVHLLVHEPESESLVADEGLASSG